VDHLTGSLEEGKQADVVVWDQSPLSMYASPDQVFAGGALIYDRQAPAGAWSDFEVGTRMQEVAP
jgi:imidazolonepropionase-like amidohydrolase